MFDQFLQFILRQRFLVLLVGAIVLVLGGVTWLRLPIDAFPDVTNVQVMILTESPGPGPERGGAADHRPHRDRDGRPAEGQAGPHALARPACRR